MKSKYTVSQLDEEIFKEDKPKTIDILTLESITKSKDGMTTTEICIDTGLKPRRVREATSALQRQKKIVGKMCRCNHTPIYFLYNQK